MIHTGDCVEVMAQMPVASVDAIVTDPPYGLEFMGKEWDRLDGAGFHAPKDEGRTFTNASGHMFDNLKSLPRYGTAQRSQEWHQRWATEALRVAKPGAYLLAFGGTRTYHRLACAIEDAGWIIRDCLVWAYASGFPKSKASLKPAWEPIVMARKPGPLRELAIDACRIPTDDTWSAGTYGGAFGNGQPVTNPNGSPLGRWPANVLLTDPIFDGGVDGVVGGGAQDSPGDYQRNGSRDWDFSSFGLPTSEMQRGYGDTGTYSRFFTIPQGTMCEWCGASSAVSSSGQPSGRAASAPSPVPTEASSDATTMTDSATTSDTDPPSWPDLNGSTLRLTLSPVSKPAAPSRSNRAKPAAQPSTSSDTTTTTPSRWMCASCAEAATRFSMAEQESAERNYPWAYLIPKADRAEREPVFGGLAQDTLVQTVALGEMEYATYPDGTRRVAKPKPRANHHPTVKPLDLMRHLVRLVTPTGGVVLDPFLGSGTTAIAAEMEGFAWLGIEREAEYVAIAEARLQGTQRGLGLDVGAPTPAASTAKGHWPKERGKGSEGWGFTGQTDLPERYDEGETA